MHYSWNTEEAMRESAGPMYSTFITSKLLASLSHRVVLYKRRSLTGKPKCVLVFRVFKSGSKKEGGCVFWVFLGG